MTLNLLLPALLGLRVCIVKILPLLLTERQLQQLLPVEWERNPRIATKSLAWNAGIEHSFQVVRNVAILPLDYGMRLQSPAIGSSSDEQTTNRGGDMILCRVLVASEHRKSFFFLNEYKILFY